MSDRCDGQSLSDGLVGKGQVCPRFGHVAVGSDRVEGLAAEHPNIVRDVLLPESYAAAGARLNVDKRNAVLDGKIRWILTGLLDVAGAFPPGPQSFVDAGGVVFPDVIEESSALRERRCLAPSP